MSAGCPPLRATSLSAKNAAESRRCFEIASWIKARSLQRQNIDLRCEICQTGDYDDRHCLHAVSCQHLHLLHDASLEYKSHCWSIEPGGQNPRRKVQALFFVVTWVGSLFSDYRSYQKQGPAVRIRHPQATTDGTSASCEPRLSASRQAGREEEEKAVGPRKL